MTKDTDDLKKAIKLAEDSADELKKSQMSLDFSAPTEPHATDWKSKKEKLGDSTQAVIGKRSISAVSLHEINGTHEGATGALIHGGNKYEAVKHRGNWHLTGNYTTNEPHHKEYTRRSKSGKVSQIAAKGPQAAKPTHRDKSVLAAAQDQMLVDNLDEKKSDREDFKEISTRGMKDGLYHAYKLGKAGEKGKADAVVGPSQGAKLQEIAKKHFGRDFREYGLDSEDFHEHHVNTIRDALREAYDHGVRVRESQVPSFAGDPKGLVNDITRKLNVTYGNDKTPMQFYVKQDENIVTVGPKAEPVARGAVMSFGSHETMSGQRERWQREAWTAAAPKILAEIKKRINVEDAGIDNGAIYFVSDDMLPKRK